VPARLQRGRSCFASIRPSLFATFSSGRTLVRPCPVTHGGTRIARKTVTISDLSGKTIQDGKGARITINFDDARKGTIIIDATSEEAEEIGRKGRRQARRGRKPKEAVSQP
jgi:hypothetical protein